MVANSIPPIRAQDKLACAPFHNPRARSGLPPWMKELARSFVSALGIGPLHSGHTTHTCFYETGRFGNPKRAKPATSDSNPMSPTSGSRLAVLGKRFSGSGCSSCCLYRRGLNNLSYCNHFSCRLNGLDRRRLQSNYRRFVCLSYWQGEVRCQFGRHGKNGEVCNLRQLDSSFLRIYKFLAPIISQDKTTL